MTSLIWCQLNALAICYCLEWMYIYQAGWLNQLGAYLSRDANSAHEIKRRSLAYLSNSHICTKRKDLFSANSPLQGAYLGQRREKSCGKWTGILKLPMMSQLDVNRSIIHFPKWIFIHDNGSAIIKGIYTLYWYLH